MTDECTTKKLRMSYARVLIEVDITQSRRDSVYIKDAEGRRMLQDIVYEWRPVFCFKCQAIGHNCAIATKAKTGGIVAAKAKGKQWQSKRAGEGTSKGAGPDTSIAMQPPNLQGTRAVLAVDKGKAPMDTNVPDSGIRDGEVVCMNGFQALQVEKDLSSAYDKVP